MSEARHTDSSRTSDEECQHFPEEISTTPDLGNTGVSTRHGVNETGGLDTLEASLYGSWSADTWSDLVPRLNKAKEAAANGNESGSELCSVEGDVVRVMPTAIKKGVYCRWVLQWHGCTIAIVNRAKMNDRVLSVHVTIGSLRLMEVGHIHAWKSVLALLASFGYEHVRDVPGRADVCVDLPGVSMEIIQDAINGGQIVCKPRKLHLIRNGDRLETVYFGSTKSPVRLRIYDKAVECRNDPVKQALLMERRWNGECCTEAVRVEFQLRNKALRRHCSIRTVDELFERLGTICVWATTSWFRIAESRVDRKNRNHCRAKTSEFWTGVQEAFDAWTGTAEPRCPEPKRLTGDFTALKKQAVGCLTTIAAHVGDTFLDVLREVAKEYHAKATEKINEKRSKLFSLNRAYIPAEVPF